MPDIRIPNAIEDDLEKYSQLLASWQLSISPQKWKVVANYRRTPHTRSQSTPLN